MEATRDVTSSKLKEEPGQGDAEQFLVPEVSLSSSLFELLATLPRTHVTVHVTGMPEVPTGKTTITRLLQKLIDSIHLSDYVTLLDHVFPVDDLPSNVHSDTVLVMCVYDVCNVKSFEYCVEKYCRPTNAPRTVLVGNKIDLEYWRLVSVRRAASTILDINRKRRSENCEAHPVTFLEISAYTGLHIGYIVDEILRIVLSPRYNMKWVDRVYAAVELHDDGSCDEDMNINYTGELKGKKTYGGKSKKKVKRGVGMLMKEMEDDHLKPPPAQIDDDIEDDLRAIELSLRDLKNMASSLNEMIMEQGELLDEVGDKAMYPSSLQMVRENDMGNLKDERWDVEDVGTKTLMDKDKRICDDDVGKEMDRVSRRKIDDISNIMQMNIEQSLERSEKLDDLCLKSETLADQAIHFQATAVKLQRQQRRRCLCCCCILCAKSVEYCAGMCRNCVASTHQNCFACFASIKLSLSKFFKRKSLMDNVLADTENAFQTLAKSLHYLIGSDMKFRCLGAVYYYAIGVWHKAVSWVVSYVLIVSATVVMILPSFFTLLIVRTSTIEKESKAFGVRQETIRHEKKEQSALRWLRIVLRSLPMSIYLLVVPYLMVYRLFPTYNNDQITYWVVGYLVGVILLQILGSVRVYHSWKSRDDTTIPAAPDMYYEEDVDEDPSARSCVSKCLPLGGKKEAFVSLENAGDVSMDQSCATQKVKRKTAVPIPPNTFTLSAGNMVVVLSLIVEYFQMASFPLQSNPLDGDSDEASSDGPGAGFPSASPTVEPASDFWGSKMFDSVYVNVGFDSDLTLTFMWVCVGMVCLLMLVFTNQFLFELRRYGNLLQRIEDKDEAKDSFFFSFTGAIVYGHGKPNNISKRMRLFVSLLSDTLFLVISMQLLTVLACDTVPDSGGERATLRAKESVECWEGEHALLSTCAMMAYAFYVPLSIMITPMLLEAPSTDSKDKPKEEGVAFLKLYLMTINVVKSVMLLVAVLGPQDISTLVLATALSSLLLGGITVAWYSKQDLSSLPYSSSVHPCNMAFINYWKAASYTTSVVSAVIVVIFHSLQHTSAFVSERSLTDTLLTAWVCIAAVYASLYYQHYKRVKWRREVVSNLITYPFQWRDEFESARDGAEAVNLSWWSDDEEVEKRRHIPGFTVSPWHDYRRSGDGLSCTESVEEVNGEALSCRLLQRFRK